MMVIHPGNDKLPSTLDHVMKAIELPRASFERPNLGGMFSDPALNAQIQANVVKARMLLEDHRAEIIGKIEPL